MYLIFKSTGFPILSERPPELPRQLKHLIFVLDTSDNMNVNKIEQLKNALETIVDQLSEEDVVSIVEMKNTITAYDIINQTQYLINLEKLEVQIFLFISFKLILYFLFQKEKIYPVYAKRNDTVNKMKQIIHNLSPEGTSNILEGSRVAFKLASVGIQEYAEHKPVVVFMLDSVPKDNEQTLTDIFNEVCCTYFLLALLIN